LEVSKTKEHAVFVTLTGETSWICAAGGTDDSESTCRGTSIGGGAGSESISLATSGLRKKICSSTRVAEIDGCGNRTSGLVITHIEGRMSLAGRRRGCTGKKICLASAEGIGSEATGG
jgi:hypothetical protein